MTSSSRQALVNKAEITFRADGIVAIHYRANSDFGVNDHREIFSYVRTNSGLKKARILLTGGDFSSHDEESRKYNASKEVMLSCVAVAMVTENLAKRIAANFFMKFYKPAAPLKFFSTKEEALQWLGAFEDEV